MKSDIAIRVENLGKRYQLGLTHAGSIRELANKWTNRFNFFKNKKRREDSNEVQTSQEFWALKDINFEVSKGEIVGIIGHNGAGKSTLLKILSRITHPTTGSADIYGRIGSLLEVGTGFHPELTGRENVFLNGAILGMTKREIKQKFDSIVDFSGVEQFIDTPVKRYSSGMRVRLAFAVAAHLEPEILLIDEVLAVGDTDFQRKCLGKMREVSDSGRTILFVSHDMAAVKALCSRVILLDGGRVSEDGESDLVVQRYQQLAPSAQTKQGFLRPKDKSVPYVTDFNMFSQQGELTNHIEMSDKLVVQMGFIVPATIHELHFLLLLHRADGVRIATICSRQTPCVQMGAEGQYEITIDIPSLNLLPGHYSWSLEFSLPTAKGARLSRFEQISSFELVPLILSGTTAAYKQFHGTMYLESNISVDFETAELATDQLMVKK